MDHVVYLDAKANEMEKLLCKKKTMLIRGAAGRKLPYGRVNSGDALFFLNNNAEGKVKARAKVQWVFNSEKMSEEESVALVDEYHDKLQLTSKQFKRWAGKRYIVLVEVAEAEQIASFQINKSEYGNMDDWLFVEDITRVRAS